LFRPPIQRHRLIVAAHDQPMAVMLDVVRTSAQVLILDGALV
jgi:hypothetical protein